MKVYPDWVSAKTPKKGYFPEVLEMILKCPRVVYSYPGLIPEHIWEIPLFGGFGTRPVGINSHPVGVKFIGSGYFSSSRGVKYPGWMKVSSSRVKRPLSKSRVWELESEEK